MSINSSKLILFIIVFIFTAGVPSPFSTYAADNDSMKQYGILIADKNSTYTWHDFSDSTAASHLEITTSGNIMLPAWRFASMIPDISYSYDKSAKVLTLKNTYNDRKITCEKNSSVCTYYSDSKAKGIQKEMPYKMYVSKKSGAVMISADTLKWIMNSSSGYQYYKTDKMQTAGYDTYSYDALLVYHPYNKITSIPKATSVKGLSSIVRVTIPEGYSVAQTFELLVKKGVCSSTYELFSACNTYDYSYYTLISELEDNENRCFRLEGYLFPDTYEFFRLSSAQDAIGRFLKNAEKKLTEEMRLRAKELGFSINEILTIASIIEKEINIASEMPNIASILYNRIDRSMRLQVDAASYYVERYIKPFIDGDINRYNSFYNTYKCAALPAGPICSPGSKAIHAALYPAETNALFFLSDSKGNYYYSETYEEHLKKLE